MTHTLISFSLPFPHFGEIHSFYFKAMGTTISTLSFSRMERHVHLF